MPVGAACAGTSNNRTDHDMPEAIYFHHRISTAPKQWAAVGEALAQRRGAITEASGALYGIWRSQIGRPRDELTAITVWSRPVTAAQAEAALCGGAQNIHLVHSDMLTPTLRPVNTQPPLRQGNYAFRWFVTPEPNWEEFLALCAQAWPGFESAYDSQVIGLWRGVGPTPIMLTQDGAPEAGIRSLLLTRRPNLAMWERSKLPQGAAEAEVRNTLSRRYDLCDWTVVNTTTLLTATDSADNARWT